MTWQPAPGEVLQIRWPIEFATGVSRLVEGRRSFRGTDRRDIEAELQADEAWPARPEFAVLDASEQREQRAVNGMLRWVPAVVGAIVNLGGPSGVGGGREPRGPRESQDPENEVEDFPVMWAERGALARNVPWELDPGRVPRRAGVALLATDLAVTDRSVYVVGYGPKSPDEAEVLWSTPRSTITHAEVMSYSGAHPDLRLTFTDGSWIRLNAKATSQAKLLVNAVNGASRVITEADLTDGQRAQVTETAKRFKVDAGLPRVFTRLPSGLVQAELWRSSHRTGQSVSVCMTDDGSPAAPHPDDM
ncbi:hypothetical protein ACIQCJ_32670 [Streptomyces sp. NPDC093221]|uniref:hypothetical protein n=1 Tax=Streptomyces sp. NPDC093221 TaxID=3366032 RepID=UPI00380A65CA